MGLTVGMLSTANNVFVICEYLHKLRLKLAEYAGGPTAIVVVDPVLRSTSGRELLDAAGVAALRDRLLPLVDWVTPNLEELAILSGRRVEGRDDVPDACRALQERVAGRRPLGVLAKGGHMDPPDDFLLAPDGGSAWLAGERVNTKATHGTGCALSSAFVSRLVLGDSPEQAARAAKLYVATAMQRAEAVGGGRGPMKHLWPLL